MKLTKVIWLNRQGVRMEHSMGCKCTLSYARDWWRRSIAECQGVLSRDERRESKLRLVDIRNVAEDET